MVIVGTPLIKGKGSTAFQKLSHLGGTKFFCEKGGINPKRRGGVDIEIGGGATFFIIYSSVQSHLLCVEEK